MPPQHHARTEFIDFTSEAVYLGDATGAHTTQHLATGANGGFSHGFTQAQRASMREGGGGLKEMMMDRNQKFIEAVEERLGSMDEMDERHVYCEMQVKKQMFKFLAFEVSLAMIKFPKNVDLKVLSSHLHLHKLQNQFKAVFELMNCEQCEPSLQEKFIIFKGKIDIQ